MATGFAVAVVLHNADHLRRGADSVALDVFVAGTLALLPEIGVVALAFARHRLAPLAALAVGAALAPAYVLVHFLPERSWLSDSLVGADGTSPLSYAAASLEVLAATALAAAGAVVLRRRGGLSSAARSNGAPAPLLPGLLHPVTFGFLVLTVLGAVLSLAQR